MKFLAAVGLVNASLVNSRRVAQVLRGPSANHNAFVATLAGMRQIMGHHSALPLSSRQNVFDYAKAVDKTYGEYLTGVIINRLASKRATSPSLVQRFERRRPIHRFKQCSAGLSWMASRGHVSSPHDENTPEAAFYKIHGSGFTWISPADVVMTMLLRLADENQVRNLPASTDVRRDLSPLLQI